jgi:glutaredoxin
MRKDKILKLELIHKWTCPYSAQVRDFIEENGLKDRIDFLEVNETEGANDRLSQLTGKTQVPCLLIDGEPQLESRDIIQWLDQNLVGAQGTARG